MIPLAKQNISEETYQKATDVLKSGWWTMGEITEQLEHEFAEYKGMKHAIAANSCSSALFLAVKALKNDDSYPAVFLPTLCFCSDANAIITNYLDPVFLDSHLNTKCINIDWILDMHKSYCQGIILLHFAGTPCDINKVSQLKRKFPEIWIIEDCAHAVEGEWKGRHLGTFGDVSCFSFNPIKNLAAPEMGMLCTNNDEIAKKVKLWRLHGMSANAYDRINKPGQYDIVDLGYKMNCTDLEAVIALEQLRSLNNNWIRRFNIWWSYCNAFIFEIEDCNGNMINLPVNQNAYDMIKYKHSMHLYQILIKNRDKFIQEMLKKDIHCGIHFKPIHKHSYYKNYINYKQKFPIADFISEHVVSLPLGPGMAKDDVNYVIESMKDIISKGEYSLGEINESRIKATV